MPSKTSSKTVSSAASSAPILIDNNGSNFAVGFGCVVPSGTLTYKVQHTFDDVMDSLVTPTWFDHADVVAKTASSDGNYAFPVRAIRLTVTAYTSGSVTLTAIQSA